MFAYRDLLLTISAVLLATTVANANLILTLDDVGTIAPSLDVIVQDNTGIGVLTSQGLTNHADSDLTPGVVGFAGPVGAFFLNDISGVSNQVLGDLTLRDLNISGAPGSLIVGLTDTDFALPSGPGIALTSETGGLTAGTVGLESLYDVSNGEFAGTTFASSVEGPGPYDVTGQATDAYSAAFSLTHYATVTHTSFFESTNVNTTLSARVIPVPEPTSILGSSLMGLITGGIFWSKRRRATMAG